MRFVVFTMAAVFVAVSSAVPRRGSGVSSGSLAAARVQQLEQSVDKCFQQLKDIAVNDNAGGGVAVSDKLNLIHDQIESRLDSSNNAIEDRNWVLAMRHVTDVKATLNQLLGDLQPELYQLSPKGAAQVRRSYGKCYETFGRLFGEIFRYLGQASG